MAVTINGSTGIAGVDGSAGTPAVQGADTNTGIFFPAADTVAVATGGSERMRVDSSGNVGIGTGTPTERLGILSALTGTTAGSNTVARFQTNGNGYDAHIAMGDNVNASTRLGYLSGNMYFWTNGAERARIDGSGNLLVGTTSSFGVGVTVLPAGQVFASRSGDVSGVFDRRDSDGQAVNFRRQGNTVGSVSVTTTATAYNTSSDYRLKEDVLQMTGALARVAALKPVTYKWKSDGSDGEGFIAHELQAVVPDCVTGEKDAVDAEGNPVTAAIQEQQALIAALQADVAALKGAQA
jgi:hypothetical protein